jgi:hypothetical protein
VFPRHSATICEKCRQINDNLNVVVLLRKFRKDSEEIFSNYESGGRTFESFRARHFGTELGTPNRPALEAATSVRSSTLFDP